MVGSRQSSLLSESIMTSANPIESFQNVYGVKCVFQYYEKVKVANALDFDEALENFEVLYKMGLTASAPSQSSKFCDVLVDESKIQTAGSKHCLYCLEPCLVDIGSRLLQ